MAESTTDKAKEAVEQPRFDFGNLSWSGMKRIAAIEAAMMDAEKTGDYEKQGPLVDELQALLQQIIVFVPRELVVNDAPDVIDWGDADQFNTYLRGDAFNVLLQSMKFNQIELQKKFIPSRN